MRTLRALGLLASVAVLAAAAALGARAPETEAKAKSKGLLCGPLYAHSGEKLELAEFHEP